MKKVIMVMLVAVVSLSAVGCGLGGGYGEPYDYEPIADYENDWFLYTEELDLALVESYEITIWENWEVYEQTVITIDTPESVEALNNFLGNTVNIDHFDGQCDCDNDVIVRIFLTTGREMWFAIHETRDGSFVFDANQSAVIEFEGQSYDELMNLVRSLGS